MKNLIVIIILIALIILGFMFISQDEPMVTESKLSLSELNLEALEEGHYEGWAIFGEEKISTGKFNIGDNLVFNTGLDLSNADKIVITIEPEGDTDDVPSGIVVLTGDLVSGEASLEFPVSFEGISGGYILATPTDGPDSNETSGVWFLELPEPLNSSLILPELPGGWVYEGWVVNKGTPLTSGRFTDVSDADDFEGFSGAEPGPDFPGEDYLVNAPEGTEFPINLADGQSLVVISVEPNLDGVDPAGEAPFSIKPLVGEVLLDSSDHTNYSMEVNLMSVPSGIATISQ